MHIDSQFIILQMTESMREEKSQAGNCWVVIPENQSFLQLENEISIVDL